MSVYGKINVNDFTLVDSKFHKKATSIGFDIVMSKKMFLMNIKTIKAQISNNVKSIQ